MILASGPCGIDPPAHATPRYRHKDLLPYPLMRASVNTEDESTTGCPWVDEKYGLEYIRYWENAKVPPTWMDPERFVRMCQADPAIKAILARCIKRNTQLPGRRELPAELDRIMEEVYLPHVLRLFERHKWLLAQWLLANHADKVHHRAELEKERKYRRTLGTSEPDE